jgi:DNA-binding NarL/FixJ family response regulator
MTDMLRVVIAEDNYLVREGVRRLLEDSGQVEVAACVGDGRELLDAVRRLTPSAVLTDIRMPPSHHMEGIEAARAIRSEYPAIGVVVLSQHTDESYARALFNDGSSGLGYLLKDRVGDLEDLVHCAQRGGVWRIGRRSVDHRYSCRSTANPRIKPAELLDFA